MYKFLIFLFLLAGCTTSEKIIRSEVKVSLDEIEDSRFIRGIKGAENICLDKDSMKTYISDISGFITLLDGESFRDLKIVKTRRVGNLVLGIAQDRNKNIYAGICNYSVDEWKEKGGAVYKLDSKLNGLDKLTDEYPGINGMTIDNNAQLYFASSNFDAFDSKGNIFKINLKDPESVDLFISDTGMANGLHYDPLLDKILYSDTTTGVYTFRLEDPKLTRIFDPPKVWELIDDLGSDSKGRIWMSDPGSSFIKCFDPNSNKLVYFVMNQLGQASSCRIRKEKGEEVIYITELTMKGKGTYDGRGLIIIPLKSLEQYL